MAKPRKQKPPKDIAILHGPTEDGEGARMLRFKEGAVYAGEVRPVREGQSVEHHELVRLKPVREHSPVCEVEVLHAPKPAPATDGDDKRRSAHGPARVSNQTYRRNWNTVFGSKQKRTPGDWSVN